MAQKSRFCQYYYKDMELATLPDTRMALPLRKRWWTLKRFVWCVSVLGLFGFAKIVPSTRPAKLLLGERRRPVTGVIRETLNLEAGDWVEVRSTKEIFATLDEKGKLRGLAFTPEMMKFCGRRFRVFKKLDRIILEATGELRKIKTPTVLLEDVFCDGKAHGECDRSCFCFWRTEWLKKTVY
jgi:hypothetical protein